MSRNAMSYAFGALRTLALVALPVGAAISLAPAPASAAVVYCTGVGIPRGCVVRTAPVVVAPVVRAPVVVAPVVTPRVYGTPGVGAPGVGYRAGVPGNRGGPVNRAGRY